MCEDRLEHAPCLLQSIRPENHHAEADDKSGAQDLKRVVAATLPRDIKPCQDLCRKRTESLSQHHQSVIIQSVKNVFSTGSVPHPVGEPDEKQGVGAGQQGSQVLALDASAQPFIELLKMTGEADRIKDVVFQPFAQCDVPATPEIVDGNGEKRTFEILGYVHAEHLGHAADHVHAAGKFCIDLEGIKEYCRELDAAAVRTGICENRVDDQPRPICDDELFEQSPDEADPAVCHPVVVERMRGAKLARQPGIAVERPLDDVWKIAQVEKEHQWIFFRFCCAAIHVHDVADPHQSVIGDPQWHEDLQHRDRCSHPEKGGDVITDGAEEIEIFRSQEHEEHQEHRTEHDELFLPCHCFFQCFSIFFRQFFFACGKAVSQVSDQETCAVQDSACSN